MIVCVLEEALASLPGGVGQFNILMFAPPGAELDLRFVAALAGAYNLHLSAEPEPF